MNIQDCGRSAAEIYLQKMNNQDPNSEVYLYDWNFVDPPSNNLMCSACNNVLKEPTLIGCCGKHYCHWCLKNQSDNSYPYCHYCERQCFPAILDKKKWLKIIELDVTCPFFNRGCLWTGELHTRAAHIDPMAGNCQYIDTVCSYECGEVIERHENDEHMTICPRRPTVCIFCKEEGEYAEIYGDHKFKCVDYIHDCPNVCGVEPMKQMLMKRHMLECPKMIIECNFNYAGCKVWTKRKYLNEHLQASIHNHIRLSTECFLNQLETKDKLFCELASSKDKQIQELCVLHFEKLSGVTEESEERTLNNLKMRIEVLKKHCNLLELNTNRQLYTSLEIDRNELVLINPVRGHRATEIWMGTFRQEQAVMKKRTSEVSATTFLLEAIVLMKLKQENIIELYGVVTSEEPMYIVLEYMFKGNLQQHLRKSGNTHDIPINHLLIMCKQVAQGLEYIQVTGLCIHRNIKAKNILLCMTQALHCKIANFRSAKCLSHYTEEYIASNNDELSLKWCAPETLQHQIFSLKSDVWSYGMFMYEVITYGSVPFPNETNVMAINRILKTNHMQQPIGCPDKFYQMMVDCWKFDPWSRPTFEAILDLLNHVKDPSDYYYII